MNRSTIVIISDVLSNFLPSGYFLLATGDDLNSADRGQIIHSRAMLVLNILLKYCMSLFIFLRVFGGVFSLRVFT